MIKLSLVADGGSLADGALTQSGGHSTLDSHRAFSDASSCSSQLESIDLSEDMAPADFDVKLEASQALVQTINCPSIANELGVVTCDKYQKSKDIDQVSRGYLDLIVECLYESDEESEEETDGDIEDLDDCSSSGDSEGSLAEHLAFLDGLSSGEEAESPLRTDCHCSMHACSATSKPNCNIKSSGKKLQKLTKKCKKLYDRYASSHLPLVSCSLLSELASEIKQMKMISQGSFK